ncbi:MAG TPA: hypothetical protein VL422_17135, partial [Miltoncostaea sp.]|nr:hypothetical protein [Miltoncostaea sp.]
MDPLDLALEEAAARRARVASRRADLRTTTGRVYGFLGGLLAVGLAVLLSAGDAFTWFFAGALAAGALALICILLARARPALPTPVDLTGHGGAGFAGDVLAERIGATTAAEQAL